MSTRSTRMEPVRRVADQRAQEAARQLAERQEAAEQEQERLAQLRAFRREYEQKLAFAGQNGIDAYRLRDYNAFLGRIDQAIAQQREQLGKLEAGVEKLREHWVAEWGNARALAQLVERYRTRERRDAEAREQRHNDELARQRRERS